MSQSGGLTVDGAPITAAAAVVAGDTGALAASAGTATLAAAVGKTTYLSGLCVTGLGATAAAVVDVTVTGPAATLHFPFAVPAGATLTAVPLYLDVDPPIPGAAPNTAVVVNVPSFGVGNTSARGSAYGYQA